MSEEPTIRIEPEAERADRRGALPVARDIDDPWLPGRQRDEAPLLPLPGRQRDEAPLLPLPGRRRDDDPLLPLPGRQRDDDPLLPLPGRRRDDDPLLPLPGRQRDDDPLLPLPGRRRDDDDAPVLPRSPQRPDVAPAQAASAPVDPPDPTKLDRFVILSRLGSGGMGIVYAAYDPQLDRKIALKIVRADRRGEHTTGADSARLLREAQAMAQLAHPNVVAVHEVGNTADGVYLAMEYVQGLTLGAWLKKQHERDPLRRGWREILGVFLQAGEGLAAAHRAGLVHRDFKPENVLVGQDGRVRVLDFGLARHRGPAAPDSHTPPGEASLDLTAAGTIVGTPAYMAPEQHELKPCDARSDQYSFCISLWEALSGARPFRGLSLKELGGLKARGVLPTVSRSLRVPRWLWPLLARGLSPRPEDRWPDMATLLAALRADPGRARLRVFAGVAALGLVVGAPVAYLDAIERAELRALAARERVCDEVTAPAGELWDDARRERLAGRFGAVGLTGTWPGIEAKIDGFVERWSAARTEVCRATRARGEQSESLMRRRDACLERTLAGLDARLDAMSTADAKALRRAGELLDVSPIDLCTASEQNKHIDPPDDSARIAALYARVDRLRAEVELKSARAVLDLEARLSGLTVDVEAAKYRPLLAALGVLRGLIAEQTGAYDEAERHYTGAIYEAEVSRDDVVALDAYTRVAWVLAFHLRKLKETRIQLDHMRATLARVGEAPALHARYLRAEALLAGESGDFDTAASLFLRASEELRKAGLVALASTSHGNVGVMYNRKGRPSEAIPFFKAAIAELDPLAEASPNQRSTPRINLGSSLLLLGRFDEALEQYRAAAAIHREIANDDPVEFLSVLMQGQIHLQRGDPGAAKPLLARALEFRREAYGPGSSKVTEAALALAHAQILLGELDDADALLAEASRYVQGDGFEQEQIAATDHYVRSLYALARGEIGGARAHLERALPLVSAADFADRRFAVDVVLALADSLWADPQERGRARELVDGLLPSIRACADDNSCDPTLSARLATWRSQHG